VLAKALLGSKDCLLTGNTDTRIVASKATINEMRARVSITAYSFFPGFHSGSENNPFSR
jgi:hypothetical protein